MTIRLNPMAKDDHMAELLLNSKVLDISGEYNLSESARANEQQQQKILEELINTP